MSALHRAAEGGHIQIVEYLLSKGVEVDSRDRVSTYNNVMYCVIVIIQWLCGTVYKVCTIRVLMYMIVNTVYIVI